MPAMALDQRKPSGREVDISLIEVQE